MTAFKTIDLSVAAFLRARGWKFHGIEVVNHGRQAAFLFDADAAKDAPAYFMDAPAPARLFAANLRDLRGLIREALSTPPQGDPADAHRPAVPSVR